MNKYIKILIGIIMMPFLSLNCWGADKNSINDVEDLQKRLLEISHNNLNIDKEVGIETKGTIIVIGPCGAGKSTLVNYISGKELEIREGDRGLVLDTNTPATGITIGHTLEAGTKIPSFWCDDVNNYIYIDFPGFEDTRGPKEDIINAFWIHQMFKTQKNMKIVLTMPECTLKDHRSFQFLKMINNLSSVFEDKNELKKCLSLVITKHTDLPKSIFTSILSKEWIKDDNLRVEHVKDFIEFFSNNLETRVSFFPYPVSYWEEKIYDSKHRDKILWSINNSEFVNKPKIGFYLDNNAKLLLNDLYTIINREICCFLIKDVNSSLLDICLEKLNSTETVNNIREFILSKIEDIKKINEIDATRPLDFLEVFKNKLKIPTNMLEKMLDQMIFFKKVYGENSFPIMEWSAYLNQTLQQLHMFSAPPQVTKDKNTLSLWGFLIGINDIKNNIDCNKDEISKINIFSLNTIFIDNNLKYKVSHNQVPLSITIISPNWVIGDYKIDLSGFDGKDGENGKLPGEYGTPGFPGGNGGSFFGKGHTFNIQNGLNINTFGGEGGKGGNGKDGAPGKNGADGDLTVVRQEGSYFYYQDKGKPGEKGQNGGKGGKGGLMGYQGTAVIEGISFVNTKQPQTLPKDGKPGKGGIGGSNGRNCQGTYVTGLPVQVPYRGSTYGGLAHTTKYKTQNTGTAWTVPLCLQETTGRSSDGKTPSSLNIKNYVMPIALKENDNQLDVEIFKSTYITHKNTGLLIPLIRNFPNL